MSKLKIEVCLESVEDAVAAQQGGADRVELCANLLEGGTTPSAGMIARTRQHIDIGLQVIVRPRGGDFLYSEAEFEVMQHDVKTAKKLGADGVVIGLLLPDGNIDLMRTRLLVESARPMSVTFHRAFDMCRDPHVAIQQLIQIGIDRLLTSGQEAHVLEGLDLIRQLAEEFGDRIILMPGCGITVRNVSRILEGCPVREIHVVANAVLESHMRHRNRNCFMGTELRTPEYHRQVTSAGHVSDFREIVS